VQRDMRVTENEEARDLVWPAKPGRPH